MSCVNKIFFVSILLAASIAAFESDRLRYNTKFLDISLGENSREKHGNRPYMDYRDVYGLKWVPNQVPTVTQINDKLDLLVTNVTTTTEQPEVKKKQKLKKRKNEKKKLEKVSLMKPPEYQEIVTPLTVVAPTKYYEKKESDATDISKLERYLRIAASVRKRMKLLQSLANSNSKGINGQNTHMPARFLDVYEVIEFEHRPFCASSPPPLARMTGSCYSFKQCTKLGGLALSSCAHGYGVCCIFKMTCNGFTEQEVSYFESPGYPAPSLNALSCSMAVLLRPKTQQLLLEFEFFELLPPTNGTCVMDKFVVLGQNTNKPIPILCGINTGQHMYIDVFDATERKIFLTVVGNGNEARGFRIKVTQLVERQAPPDCLQYHVGTTGMIKSFNYDELSLIVRRKFASYLNNLNYAICIKRSPGFCTVTYTTEESGAVQRTFQLRNVGPNGVLTVPEGQAGAEIFNCPDDYISVNSIRLCGDRLNDASVTDNFTVNAPVVDYSFGPIVLPVRTNGELVGRGFDLRYTQMPCQRTILSV